MDRLFGLTTMKPFSTSKKTPKTLLGYQVFRHKLGTPQSDDVLVYEEKDRSFYTRLGKTRDDGIVYIYHDSTTNQEPLSSTPTNQLEASNLCWHWKTTTSTLFKKLGDWFYIRTNWDAQNFRLMKVPVAKANDKKNWEVVIPHDPKSYFNSFEIFKNYLVVADKIKGNNRIRSFELKTMKETTLQFDDPVFLAGFRGNRETDTDIVRLFYSSQQPR